MGTDAEAMESWTLWRRWCNNNTVAKRGMTALGEDQWAGVSEFTQFVIAEIRAEAKRDAPPPEVAPSMPAAKPVHCDSLSGLLAPWRSDADSRAAVADSAIMKCISCILNATANKNLTDETVKFAVDSAEPAVTIYNDEPLCVHHLQVRLIGRAIREIALAQ